MYHQYSMYLNKTLKLRTMADGGDN